jgi:hypothetical protein
MISQTTHTRAELIEHLGGPDPRTVLELLELLAGDKPCEAPSDAAPASEPERLS